MKEDLSDYVLLLLLGIRATFSAVDMTNTVCAC